VGHFGGHGNLTLRDEIGLGGSVSQPRAGSRSCLPNRARNLGNLLAAKVTVQVMPPLTSNWPNRAIATQRAIQRRQLFRERGYGENSPGHTVIILWFSPRHSVEATVDSCARASQNTMRWRCNEEDTERRDIFLLAAGPQAGWQQFWARFSLRLAPHHTSNNSPFLKF